MVWSCFHIMQKSNKKIYKSFYAKSFKCIFLMNSSDSYSYVTKALEKTEVKSFVDIILLDS